MSAMPELTPIERLRKHCEDYKAHLEADLELLARRYLPKKEIEGYYQTTDGAIDIEALIKRNGSGKTLIHLAQAGDYVTPDNPTLVSTIKKLNIVNQMVEKLSDKSVADDRKRVENMAALLTTKNQQLLEAHRAVRPGSSFLKIIFDIILKTFNRDLRPKTTGQKLAEEIQKLRESSTEARETMHPASRVPDKKDEEEVSEDEEGENLFDTPDSRPGNLADETTVVLELDKDKAAEEEANIPKKWPGHGL